ncbi:MAG TPA: response regulator transcription factor [Pyrinomonadaceae bacterium]|nr:response regulator transcription factor [Pyrinomonadaceae bacterium]
MIAKIPNQVVFVVDDDASMRDAISRLLNAVGLTVQTFASARAFLNRRLPDVPGCVVLDVRLPGLSGLDLQREMVERGIHIPVVFITGHGDIPMSVQAMKAGAVEFLTKPFRDQDLLDAVRSGIQLDRKAREERAELAELRDCVRQLTQREQEVMSLVVSGLLNKQIALQLGTSEKTIKIHRGQVMRKMRATSLADLVRMSQKLGLALISHKPCKD